MNKFKDNCTYCHCSRQLIGKEYGYVEQIGAYYYDYRCVKLG